MRTPIAIPMASLKGPLAACGPASDARADRCAGARTAHCAQLGLVAHMFMCSPSAPAPADAKESALCVIS